MISNKVNTDTNTQTEKSSTSINNESYFTAAKSFPKPEFSKKDHAIMVHAEEGLKLFDYVQAIGGFVGPKNITFISRISNNRICIYLCNSSLVDQVITTHPTIKIEETEHVIRRFNSPRKRIFISNVSPSIPNDFIEKALISLGLKLLIPFDDGDHVIFQSSDKMECFPCKNTFFTPLFLQTKFRNKNL